MLIVTIGYSYREDEIRPKIARFSQKKKKNQYTS